MITAELLETRSGHIGHGYTIEHGDETGPVYW
jgi:hypothetical protein